MQANIGGVDRVVRIVAGLALVGAALGGLIGAWGWFGIVPLATGAIGYCPAYKLFGFRSCPLQKQEGSK
ncbi:DUF2892 domain-containing protein [Crenobacter sp. SG2303]|uniref:DUF2892 domain-containing protein n=1 Tax=Crenobacter oryzisoli TaxID=3056844 RepID=A0ABT7XV85_9NEIS|nr:DUF2892 domain-containing protein [Crenobacter sp. SG2303]MDN0077718.1 DUF2892 domain-containing protein [Crenobacter sp. SG2303]